MTPRATPLPPDERRAAIVAAARPLVADHGAQVTTAQIAAAAGIAEGTLFRVFRTKGEIIAAVVRDTLDTGRLVTWVGQLPPGDLRSTARAVLVELQGRYSEASRMFAALFQLGREGQDAATPTPEEHGQARAGHLVLRDAIATALAAHQAQLRVTPAQAASLLLGLATISSHGLVSDGTLTDPELLLDLFLHGTTKDPA